MTGHEAFEEIFLENGELLVLPYCSCGCRAAVAFLRGDRYVDVHDSIITLNPAARQEEE